MLIEHHGDPIQAIPEGPTWNTKPLSVPTWVPSWPTLSPALHPYILTEYKGKAKIHRPSFASLKGTNDPHRYILTKYKVKAKIHRPSFASLEGTNDGNLHPSTSLHPHWIQRESKDPSPILYHPGGHQRCLTKLQTSTIPLQNKQTSSMFNSLKVSTNSNTIKLSKSSYL